MRRPSGCGGYVAAWCALICLANPAAAAPKAPTAAFDTTPRGVPAVAPAVYVPAPAIRIFRFYVYAKIKHRTKALATIESFVSTSERPVVEADRAVIEREVGSVWAAVANATVTKLLPNGKLELTFDPASGAAAKRTRQPVLAAGQKVRLRIDRQLPSE